MQLVDFFKPSIRLCPLEYSSSAGQPPKHMKAHHAWRERESESSKTGKTDFFKDIESRRHCSLLQFEFSSQRVA